MSLKTATLVWRAGKDTIAHGSVPREPWTLCGRAVVLERLAWPADRRCRVCELRAGELA